MLPVGLALLSFRSLQAMVQILMGQREMVIASHEAEELVEENKDALGLTDGRLFCLVWFWAYYFWALGFIAGFVLNLIYCTVQ